MSNKFCGKLAYVGGGLIGTIVGYDYSESHGTAAAPSEHFVYRILRSKQTKEITLPRDSDIRPTIIESVKFAQIDNVRFVVLKIKGQSFMGWSIKAPGDVRDNNLGKRLAIARARGDRDAERLLLDSTAAAATAATNAAMTEAAAALVN